MVTKNAKNRPSESEKKSQNSESKAGSGSVGNVSRPSAEIGTHPIGVSREDSNKSNNFVRGEQSVGSISGEVVKQLVDETEKQLEYHKQQVEILQNRLNELNGIEIHPE